jgi:acetoin utilization protein AcuC
MGRFAVVYSERLREYDLGHVLKGDRYQIFMDLFRERLGRHPDFEVLAPPYATEDDLKLIHTQDYIQRVERCEGRDPMDTPLSPRFVRAAKLLAGAGKHAGELVQSGEFQKAFVIGGGVQHATRSREKGFGVFSDVGICAENLMRNFGVERILILDTDAHAGDGLYDIFCHDPKVLFVSIHQDPRTLYPGTGFASEMGKGAGRGYSVNIPLPPGAGRRSYAHALREIFIPLCEAFEPEILLMVDGSDPHFTDQITQMGLTLEGIRMVGRMVGRMADRVCKGKIVDFVGSGYSARPGIVSEGWLASIAGVTGLEIELKESVAVPQGVVEDAAFKATAVRVRSLQKALSPYWSILADP